METQQNSLLCPICKSSALSANQETLNNTRAAIGGIMLGAQEGLLYGSMGPKKVIVTCLACGHTFGPGEGATETDFYEKNQMALEKLENIKQSRANRRWIAFVLLILISMAIWVAFNSLFNQNTVVQTENSETNLAGSNNNGTEYIVTVQRANFYSKGLNDGEWRKRRAYLVEGEKIVSLKQEQGYIYCEFTNPVTQKTTKGWVSNTDLKSLSNDSTQTSN